MCQELTPADWGAVDALLRAGNIEIAKHLMYNRIGDRQKANQIVMERLSVIKGTK